MKKWMIALIVGSVSTVLFAQADDPETANMKAKLAAEEAGLAGNTGMALAQLKSQNSVDCKANPDDCAKLKREAEQNLSLVREKINTEISGMSLKLTGAGFGMVGPVVKGAPYSAQSVTESIQMLPDGNRIVNRTSFYTYRDHEGRMARAEVAKDGGPPLVVYILDPVANTSISLNARGRVAEKAALQRPAKSIVVTTERQGAGSGQGAGTGQGVGIGQGAGGAAKETISSTTAIASAPESLGKRVIQGVEAEGTLTVTTIKAGDIGNERPIEIVLERWYSPELHTIVLGKRTDPRFGETTFQLMDIQRGDPAASYFEVPADYKLVEPQSRRPAK